MTDAQLKQLDKGRGACAMAPGEPCEFHTLGTFADQSGKVGTVEVWQCARCRMGITMPPLSDVAFLYEGRDSDDFQPTTGGLARRIKNVAFRRQARGLLAQLPAAPGRVLDFGCGSGQFTRCLGDILGPNNVSGSDFHTEPPAELEGRQYLPMSALADQRGSFDTVMAMHVLEHDDDALGLLARISEMARSGGTVILETPNIDCVWATLLKASWDAWYVPFHRTHFSPASLAELVTKSGLELVASYPVTVPTMGRSLANALGQDNTLPFLLAGIALHPLQVAGERLSGRPSALRIIARRG